MTERIIRHQPKPEDEDIAGKPISPERLAELYPDRENLTFWDFVQQLRSNNWPKFCVSRAMLDYDPEMRFFEIGEIKKSEAPEIKFLGKGGTSPYRKILSKFAAKTWGFAVLELKRDDGGDK